MNTTQTTILIFGAVVLIVIWAMALMNSRRPPAAPAPSYWPPVFFHPEWEVPIADDDAEPTGQFRIPVPDDKTSQVARTPVTPLATVAPVPDIPPLPTAKEDNIHLPKGMARGMKVSDMTNPKPFGDDEPTNPRVMRPNLPSSDQGSPGDEPTSQIPKK
ncbi:MAG TPA: hypothetical protein PLD47_17880 [Aggregatilineales bacterium]|nr:hypothetical protein [Anaerolineales bacterium]HRE49598.1 hypothetical protein [Aggregatilineales bacterium]